jgi:hypothetical protein
MLSLDELEPSLNERRYAQHLDMRDAVEQRERTRHGLDMLRRERPDRLALTPEQAATLNDLARALAADLDADEDVDLANCRVLGDAYGAAVP